MDNPLSSFIFQMGPAQPGLLALFCNIVKKYILKGLLEIYLLYFLAFVVFCVVRSLRTIAETIRVRLGENKT